MPYAPASNTLLLPTPTMTTTITATTTITRTVTATAVAAPVLLRPRRHSTTKSCPSMRHHRRRPVPQEAMVRVVEGVRRGGSRVSSPATMTMTMITLLLLLLLPRTVVALPCHRAVAVVACRRLPRRCLPPATTPRTRVRSMTRTRTRAFRRCTATTVLVLL